MPKIRLSKNKFAEQIIAAPRRNLDGGCRSMAVSCGAIITANDVIQYETSLKEEKPKARAQDHMKELNLLSMGKKLLDFCKCGNAAEVQKLMQEGAPLIADWVGTSPLHYSVINKHVEVTELLLKHGISKDTKNKVDRTPLHIAAHMGLAYMVKLLLTYGAEVNCKDMLLMTPLHWAAESGDLLTAKILIDYGADITVVNKFGKTAWDMARANKHMDIVKAITDTEMLPLSSRALKVCDMKSKVVTCPRDMKPVAEILEPCPEELKITLDKEATKKKKKLVVITTDDVEGPMGTIRFGSVIDPTERCETPDEMSADSAIKLLKSHGVSVIEPDKDTVVSSAVLNGHTIRLTDAGKLAFKSLEKNLRLEKLPPPPLQDSEEDVGTPAKRVKRSSGSTGSEPSMDEDVKISNVVGSSLAPCTLDLPSLDSTNTSLEELTATLDSIKNPADRTKVFIQRLKDKKKEILRHLEIIENQRTIKQNELNQVNKQIRSLESFSNTFPSPILHYMVPQNE